jgi:hypothetical protein
VCLAASSMNKTCLLMSIPLIKRVQPHLSSLYPDTCCERVGWFRLAQGTVQWRSRVRMIIKLLFPWPDQICPFPVKDHTVWRQYAIALTSFLNFSFRSSSHSHSFFLFYFFFVLISSNVPFVSPFLMYFYFSLFFCLHVHFAFSASKVLSVCVCVCVRACMYIYCILVHVC